MNAFLHLPPPLFSSSLIGTHTISFLVHPQTYAIDRTSSVSVCVRSISYAFTARISTRESSHESHMVLLCDNNFAFSRKENYVVIKLCLRAVRRVRRTMIPLYSHLTRGQKFRSFSSRTAFFFFCVFYLFFVFVVVVVDGLIVGVGLDIVATPHAFVSCCGTLVCRLGRGGRVVHDNRARISWNIHLFRRQNTWIMTTIKRYSDALAINVIYFEFSRLFFCWSEKVFVQSSG